MAEQTVDLVRDLIKPTPRQRDFMRAVVRHRYVLYGGSAGGGKSHSLRWTLVWLLTRWAAKGHRNVRVGLFCEDYPALKERHLSKVEIEFPEWLGKMRSADHEYRLNPEFGGGTIAFRNLDDPSKYLSSEFAAIAVDEITKNDLNTFNFLRMRLRWPGIEDTRFMAATNPGGKGHCVPYGDVLTPNGWVDIKELKVGDPVYGVSHDGSLMETVVGQTHAHPYAGPLWVAKARGLHIACTPEHRIAKGNGVRLDSCRKFSLVKADELPGQSLVLRGVRYDGQPIESFTAPVFQQRVTKLKQPDTITGDQYARLMGWFLSEGCVIDCYKTFVITQMKQENLPVIESLLKGCGFSYRLTGQGFSVCSGKWWNYLRRFGKCREKYVPRELLNASTEQLRLFLEAAMAGDGHWASEDSGQYYTLSKRLADDMCEVLLKLGFTVSVNGRNRMGRNGLSYTVNFRRGEFQEILTGQHVYDVETECLKPKNVAHEPFDGMVYDIGVPEHHAFVIRQKGTVWVSGNSWVKGFWMDRSFPEEMEHLKDDFVFIPAKASDNPHLAESYIDGLRSLPEHLRKAYLDGSWDIFEGQVFCYDDKTEILSESGWKPIGDVVVGEKVATSSPSGELSYVPTTRVVSFDIDDELYTYDGRTMDFAVTKGHTMFVRTMGVSGDYKLRPIESLSGWVENLRTSLSWDGVDMPTVTIGEPKPYAKKQPFTFDTGDFCELLGWYLSEGSLDKVSRNCVAASPYRGFNIGQKKPEGRERIIELLDKMGLCPQVRKTRICVNSTILADYFEQFGKVHDKFIPRWAMELGRPYLKRLYDGLVAGDGHVIKKTGTVIFASTSRKLTDDFQELCIKLGYVCTISEVVRSNPKHHDCYRATVFRPDATASMIKPERIKKVPYKGKVYCVTVEPHHTVMVRRNGKPMWSGNTEWDSTRHIEDDPVIDPSWMKFRSMDWGFSKPYAIHWHAVDNDGCIHTYREMYGCREGMPDTGTQETADEVARKVARVEKGESISYGVADPAIWSKTGVGPSIAEEFSRHGVHFMPADNNRLAGKEQVHKRLRDGSWKISRSCRGLIRTLPILTYDPFKVEDVNTREEDHAYDSARYGLMTRPWTPYVDPVKKPRDRWARDDRTEGGEGRTWMAV